MTGPLEGVALVTGASSGIGEAVARALGAAGMTVVVNSRGSVEAGERVAEEIGGSYLRADVSHESEAGALVERAVARHGRLDLLVNNAGTTVQIPHHDLAAATTEVWRRIFDTNVLGAWWVTRAAVPHLSVAAGNRKANGAGAGAGRAGHVVNVTSLAGLRAVGSSIPYAVSKAALNHLTVLLAATLGPAVRVNAVAPGLVDTPWTADWDEMRAAVTATAPLRRPGTPEDVAEVVLGLHRSTYVTGEVVTAAGGLQMRV
jgi:ketoreductase RED2